MEKCVVGFFLVFWRRAHYTWASWCGHMMYSALQLDSCNTVDHLTVVNMTEKRFSLSPSLSFTHTPNHSPLVPFDIHHSIQNAALLSNMFLAKVNISLVFIALDKVSSSVIKQLFTHSVNIGTFHFLSSGLCAAGLISVDHICLAHCLAQNSTFNLSCYCMFCSTFHKLWLQLFTLIIIGCPAEGKISSLE